MAQTCALLEKKLEELELQLNEVFVHPAAEDNPSNYRLLLKIHSRFGFLKKLLSTEMESQTLNNPEHLNQIAARLSGLENDFIKWAEAFPDDHVDTLSTCSCTYSCFNEGEGEEEQEQEQEQEEIGLLDPPYSDPLIENLETCLNSQRTEAGGSGERKQRWLSGSKGGVLCGVMVFAVALIGVAITNLSKMEEKVFLVPT